MQSAQQVIDTKMTGEESGRLKSLESVIERGRQTFIEVGSSLMEIRDSRLYRDRHDTFEKYCQDRWGFNRNFANKIIASSEVAIGMGTIVPISNETTAREFVTVPPEDRPAVAQEAKTIAAEKGRETINSRDVKEAKAKVYKTEPKVTTIEPEANAEPISVPEEPPVTTIQDSFDDWVKSLQVYNELSGIPKRKFLEGAKIYFEYETDLKAIAKRLRRRVDSIPHQFRPFYSVQIMRSFVVSAPSNWLKCRECDGSGQIPKVGNCNACKGDGFHSR